MKKIIASLMGLLLITGLEGMKRKAEEIASPSPEYQASKRPAFDAGSSHDKATQANPDEIASETIDLKKIPGSSPPCFIDLSDTEALTTETFKKRLANSNSGIEITEVFTVDGKLNPMHHYFFMDEFHQHFRGNWSTDPINKLPISRESLQAFYLNDFNSELEPVPLEHVFLHEADQRLLGLAKKYYNGQIGGKTPQAYLRAKARYEQVQQADSRLARAAAQLGLGNMYRFGNIGNRTPQDCQLALKYLTSAAKQNYDKYVKAQALVSLGNMYKEGQVGDQTPQDYQLAQKYLIDGAKQDDNKYVKAAAQVGLGNMYLEGRIGSKKPKDFKLAQKYLKQAAQQDDNKYVKAAAQKQLEKMEAV